MSMIADERHRFILDQVKQHGAAKISDLAEQLGVSEMTIHRDLNTLAQRNLLRKVHGGAVAGNFIEVPYSDRAVRHHDAKVAIAKEARSLVRSGMNVYLSPGSTTYELAVLLDVPNLNIYTNSLPIASALARANRQNVTLLGGRVVGFAEALVGPLTEDTVQKQFFHLAFLGMTGLDETVGMTVYTEEEVRILQAVLRASRKTVLLSDASKFDQVAAYSVGPLYTAHALITNGLPDKYRAYCAQHDLDVTVVAVKGEA